MNLNALRRLGQRLGNNLGLKLAALALALLAYALIHRPPPADPCEERPALTPETGARTGPSW
jgi:hypothetical protein